MLGDSDHIARALFHAGRGRGRTSPNPMVGAVVVSADGVVVGHGYHERAGEAHAEVRALDMASVHGRGGTLYCTLEPCCHVGRTGPCVVRVVEAGIRRVVACTEDPDPRVSGGGFDYLRAHGVRVDAGLGAADAEALNRAYFMLMRRRRPFVILKAAISLDNGLAEAAGCRTDLTSDPANRHAHQLRAEVDAIGVGVGTLLCDDPLLTPRGAFRERPLTRVIFDRQLRTPADARVLSTQDAGPVMILTTSEGASRREPRARLEEKGALIEVVDGSFRQTLECLGARQIGSLLLEGGAVMHQAAWDEGLVDLVQVYITPHVLGPRAVPFLEGRSFSTALLHDRRVTPLGPDVLVEGYVHGPR
jgi:diaminohydroxyphosphoribosylaminopyrimidine deaminase/5-amino-6-(5-phosphoribosylamino)uracil reductase